PVTLTSFYAEAYDNNTVSLTWETETEFNNDYYIIERSTDGQTFEPFMQLDAKGNSSDKTTYFAVDAHPNLGINYYKLSQVDLNGRTTYLKTASVDVQYNNSFGTISIYDLSGRIIHSEVVYRSQIAVMLDAIQLDPGVYVYRYLQENGVSENGKFSVVR
ncbi:MAG TPA: T9SS type A sorting domain-containing protein, partial [Chitinophagales bacterium]|nr:T9SS type A sorting domain-containing protein [Chitinophagales bacterium]